MSQEIATFGSHLPANPAELMKGLQNMGGNIASGIGGGLPILRLIKSGEFVFGPENLAVEEGSEWAVNLHTLQHGYACWVDSELLGEQLVPFNLPAPDRNALPDYGGEWKQEASVELKCLNGEDEGVTVLYKSTALGFRSAIKKLIVEIMQQVQTDPAHPYPVIDLGVDSYQHKKHGLTFTPVLSVLRWIDAQGNSVGAPAPALAAAQPAPVAATPAAAATPPPAQADATASPAAASPEAAAGARRRRRATA